MDQKNLLSHTFELMRKQRFHQRWRQVVTCLAAVVVFLTTYMLILPAITMEHGSMEVTATASEMFLGETNYTEIHAKADDGRRGKCRPGREADQILRRRDGKNSHAGRGEGGTSPGVPGGRPGGVLVCPKERGAGEFPPSLGQRGWPVPGGGGGSGDLPRRDLRGTGDPGGPGRPGLDPGGMGQISVDFGGGIGPHSHSERAGWDDRTATESEWEETATDSEWPKGYVLEQRGDPKLEGWLALSWGSGRTRKAARVRAADQEDVLELSWTGEDTAREIYQYEDEQIAVTAIPESPEALPGPVWLQVTEVNPNTEG